MDHQVKQVLFWHDHQTGGKLEPEELLTTLLTRNKSEVPADLQPGFRRLQQNNKGARLRLARTYVFEQTAFYVGPAKKEEKCN